MNFCVNIKPCLDFHLEVLLKNKPNFVTDLVVLTSMFTNLCLKSSFHKNTNKFPYICLLIKNKKLRYIYSVYKINTTPKLKFSTLSLAFNNFRTSTYVNIYEKGHEQSD